MTGGQMPARRPRMPQDETRGAGPIERPTRRRESERADQTGARSGGAETRPLCRLGYTLSGIAAGTRNRPDADTFLLPGGSRKIGGPARESCVSQGSEAVDDRATVA